jgi:hypothetical protein
MINHVQVIFALDSLLDELKSHQNYGIDAQCGASLNMLTNAYVLSSGFAGPADAGLSLQVFSPVVKMHTSMMAGNIIQKKATQQ